MIKVNCVVNSVDADGKKALNVSSVSDGAYGEVVVRIGEAQIRINGEDLIQAVTNCMECGRRRVCIPYRSYRDENRSNCEEE